MPLRLKTRWDHNRIRTTRMKNMPTKARLWTYTKILLWTGIPTHSASYRPRVHAPLFHHVPLLVKGKEWTAF